MKLQCQINVINRSQCNLNLRPNCKYVKSTLALGKELKCETEFFILHFSSVNKCGTKYRIKSLKQVFTKCINEGKCTIRFEEPPHDLCIKSESIQLKCFLRLLKSCVTGDPKALQLTQLSSLSVTAKDNAPTKLVIHDRSQFPSKGLPRTLEFLKLNGLKLCNFRREILLLKQLTILDLSNNKIEKIPVEFGRMPNLRELYLENNQLGVRGEVDWRWLLQPLITKTLKLLDLSGNKLRHLPKAMWKLEKLVTLKLDNNELEKLPPCIGRLNNLRYLTVSSNNLETLPCSLFQCRLENIDIFANKFTRPEQKNSTFDNTPWEFNVGNLVNIASKIVLKHKIFYASNIIPWTLVELLDDAKMCVCGAPVVTNVMPYRKEFELKDVFTAVMFDGNRHASVEFECYSCSKLCFMQMIS